MRARKAFGRDAFSVGYVTKHVRFAVQLLGIGAPHFFHGCVVGKCIVHKSLRFTI